MKHADMRGAKERLQRIVLFSLLLMFCACAGDPPSTPIVGGACQYAAFDGKAEIVSITPLGQGGDGVAEEVAVKFLFEPKEPLNDALFKPQKPYTMQTEDLRSPTLAFVKKNDLVVGRVIDAQMELIRTGACTPLLFHFPGLRD